jgi:putative membrane protein
MTVLAASGSLHLGEALPPILGILGWALLYRRRCRTLARRGRPVARGRQVAFAAGAVLIVAALSSPIDKLAGELLYVHMAQHLLLADVAALLIALSLTGPVLGPLWRRRPVAGLHLIGHPLVALPLWIADLYLWHLPALYELALRNDAVHALQHLMFFACGLNMWLALAGAVPVPRWFRQGAQLGYVAAVRFAGMLLANLLIFSGSVLYPRYRAGEALHGVAPLTDQRIAGALMMIEGMVLAIGIFAWLFVRGAAEGERVQALLDLAGERGVPLTDTRAARAVTSGQEAALRGRVAGDET